jgi:hypothetical protein
MGENCGVLQGAPRRAEVSDEAKPDVPPPRYEQVGNFQQLICDEQEWLARPASWGIRKLPDGALWRKRDLFDYYLHSKLAEFVQCDVCRKAFPGLISEESIIFRGEAAELRQKYAELHPTSGPRCAGWSVWRASINYANGIVCQAEARNSTLDVLFGLAHQIDRTVWDRWLSLELVGPNPFRPIAFNPAWRTDTALSLANQMYDSRDFGAMPILADALQDAGCEDGAILQHCRDAKQPHVRGCWVVDLVLGKE